MSTPVFTLNTQSFTPQLFGGLGSAPRIMYGTLQLDGSHGAGLNDIPASVFGESKVLDVSGGVSASGNVAQFAVLPNYSGIVCTGSMANGAVRALVNPNADTYSIAVTVVQLLP
jgi:hypothetical protein